MTRDEHRRRVLEAAVAQLAGYSDSSQAVLAVFNESKALELAKGLPGSLQLVVDAWEGRSCYRCLLVYTDDDGVTLLSADGGIEDSTKVIERTMVALVHEEAARLRCALGAV